MPTCETCGESFVEESRLFSHIIAEHPPWWLCPQCKKKFPLKKRLHNHISAGHCPQRGVACNEPFASQEAVQSHRMAEHSSETSNFTGAVEPTISALQNSLQPNYKEAQNNVKVKCNYCLRMFNNIDGRYSHEMAKHLTNRCDSCGSVFHKLEILEQHKRDTHSLYCHYCTCQFPTDALRYQHELAQHPIHKRDQWGYCRTGSLLIIKPDTSPVSLVDRDFEQRLLFCSFVLAGDPPPAFSPRRLALHQQDVHVEFKCNHCSRRFKRIEGLKAHEAAKHLTTYRCEHCEHTFPSAKLLAAHDRATHGSFKCSYCEDIFESDESRYEHQIGHFTHYCDCCDWRFYTSEALEEHKRYRNDLYCRYCSYYFATVDLRDLHEYLTHKCDSCQWVYLDAESLQRHKEASHSLLRQRPLSLADASDVSMLPSPSGGASLSMADCSSSPSPPMLPRTLHQIDPSSDPDAEQSGSQQASESQISLETHHCDSCNWVFYTPEILEQHKRDAHSLYCYYCTHQFSTDTLRHQHELAQHPIHKRSQGRLAQHQQDVRAKVKCDYCPRTFKRIEFLNQHKAVKHPTAYKCVHCDYILPSAEFLLAHNRDMHASFECDYCEDIFESDEDRDQHQTIHLTHYCDSCDWVFYTSEVLEQHKHDRHNLYCRYCSSYFPTVDLRDQHERLTHKHYLPQWADSLQQHKVVGHSLRRHRSSSLVSTSDISMPRSTSGGFSFSTMVDYSSLPSSPMLPRTLRQFDLSSDSDTEQWESQPVSELRMSAETNLELDEDVPYGVDVTAAVPDASGVIDREPDDGDKCVVPAVQSSPTAVGPDGHQVVNTCPSCRWVFESDGDPQIHECGSPEKMGIPFRCQFCYSQFEDEASFQQHLTERISLSCDMCNLKFCCDSVLRDHIETHPTCDKCGQSFIDEPSLYRHTEPQHPVIVCRGCEGAITSEDGLDVHHASEHPPCTICGARMRTPDALLEHINEQHLERHSRAEHLLEPDHVPDTQDTSDFYWNDSPVQNVITRPCVNDAKVDSALLSRNTVTHSHFKPVEIDTSEHPETMTEPEESVCDPHVGSFDPNIGVGNDGNETSMDDDTEEGKLLDLLPIRAMFSFCLSFVSSFFP
ncbi:hypothetical protein V8B97DRAFT_1929751 [Scleroderma yunnanense]